MCSCGVRVRPRRAPAPLPGCPGGEAAYDAAPRPSGTPPGPPSSPGPEAALAAGPVTVVGVNTKTRTRIVTGALVVLFVVVVLASALGGN